MTADMSTMITSTEQAPVKSCLVHKKPSSAGVRRSVTLEEPLPITVHDIDHYADLSETEAENLWYTVEDLEDIKADNELSAGDMEDHYGECLDLECLDDAAPDGETWRGLEFIAENGQWERYQNRRNCSNGVLDEVDRQLDKDPYTPSTKKKEPFQWDHNAIAAVSIELTQEPREIALKRGHYDWRQVEQDFYDMKSLWRTGQESTNHDSCMPEVTRPPQRMPSLDCSEITAPLTDIDRSDDEGHGEGDDDMYSQARLSSASLLSVDSTDLAVADADEATIATEAPTQDDKKNVVVEFPRKARIGRSSTFSSSNRSSRVAAMATKMESHRTKPSTNHAPIRRTNTAKAKLSCPSGGAAATATKSTTPRPQIRRSSTNNAKAASTRRPIQRSNTAKASINTALYRGGDDSDQAKINQPRTRVRRSSTFKAKASQFESGDATPPPGTVQPCLANMRARARARTTTPTASSAPPRRGGAFPQQPGLMRSKTDDKIAERRRAKAAASKQEPEE